MGDARTGGNEIVIALYRSHPGKAADLDRIVEQHWPALLRLGFVTERPPVRMRGSDGTVIEVFEWRAGAAEAAHHHPEVEALWRAMGEVADFPTLADLPEAKTRFCHFRPA